MNEIFNEDCIDTMSRMPDNYLDLTVTSPPYDNLRQYEGYIFDFRATAEALWRVTKKGGVVVWVVGDATIKGSETGTSFKHALGFMDIGFNLHDTMIYEKSGFSNPSNNRYHQVFEYMFVFSKRKPKAFNPIRDRENKYKGVHGGEKSFRANYGMRFNVWRYQNGGNNTSKDSEAFEHPAPFPEKLVRDHILSWSHPSHVVYDPFAGSGTTGVVARENHRKFLLSEVSKDYCKLIQRRFKRRFNFHVNIVV